jgi:hypothetical protein
MLAPLPNVKNIGEGVSELSAFTTIDASGVQV